MESIKNEDENLLKNKICEIILNGIIVDKLLRVQSTYVYIGLDEIKSEIFSIIFDLLHNQSLPIWMCQNVAWYYVCNEYNLDDFKHLFELKQENNELLNRDKLNIKIRNKIPKILENWLKLNENDVFGNNNNANKLEYSQCSIKNKRRTLEDKFSIYDDLNMFLNSNNDIEPHCLFGVFDGHTGIEAVQYVSTHLPFYILNHHMYNTNIEDTLLESYDVIDKRLCEKALNESFKSGTTCLICIIRNNKLHISWCGDTQMCLIEKNSNEVKFLSAPHKPNSESEKMRIEQLGGRVDFISNDWRVNGTLSVARSFGDIDHKKFVIAKPEIVELEYNNQTDNYLVLGCDGLWEYIKIDDICKFINECELKHLSELLVKKAKENGSTDNITCIVVSLKSS